MHCIDCPYIKILAERSVSGFSESDIEMLRAGNMIPAECFCIKAGNAVYPEDRCFDMELEGPRRKKHSRKKRRMKRERGAKYRNHLKILASGEFTRYAGAYYADWLPKPYYVRYWRSSRRSRFQYWKKYSNGYVRRYKGEIHKGCAYKKIFDYWWTVD